MKDNQNKSVMTAERKQAEITARQYLRYEGYFPGFNFTIEQVAKLMDSYASLRVAEATKEMYPKEFILWKDANADYDEEDELYFTTTDEMMGIGTWLTFEAVFEYWKQNIRK
jgi:hypothetical protein